MSRRAGDLVAHQLTAAGRHSCTQVRCLTLAAACACNRRKTLETRLAAATNEVASMAAREDPMARQPALEADIARLQGAACAAVRTAPTRRTAFLADPSTSSLCAGLACTAQARGAAVTRNQPCGQQETVSVHQVTGPQSAGMRCAVMRSSQWPFCLSKQGTLLCDCQGKAWGSKELILETLAGDRHGGRRAGDHDTATAIIKVMLRAERLSLRQLCR